MLLRFSLRSAIGLCLVLASCSPKKQEGFSAEESQFRFKTVKFEDSAILAQAHGQKFTRDQILDKSAVLEDLEKQFRIADIGLAYLRLTQMIPEKDLKGTFEVFQEDPKIPLNEILNRFERQAPSGFSVVYKKPVSNDVFAKFKDQTISRDELPKNHAVLQGLEQRKFSEIVSQLSGQLARILVNEEASKKQLDLQTYINDVVHKNKSTIVSDQELYDYTDRIGLAREEVKGELADKMRLSLGTRKQQEALEIYVRDQILKGAPVEVSFAKPDVKIELDSSWKPIAGYNDAPVSVVVFASPTCPDCVQLVKHVETVFRKYDGHLKLNWIYDYNITDGIARMISHSALCIDSLKKGSVLPFLNEFSPKADQSDESNFSEWVKSKGASQDAFKACLSSELSQQLLDKHLEYANKVGIVANPTVWIDGHTLPGMITANQLDSTISEAIKESGSTWYGALWRRIKSYFQR